MPSADSASSSLLTSSETLSPESPPNPSSCDNHMNTRWIVEKPAEPSS